jgi:hypothetical protein
MNTTDMRNLKQFYSVVNRKELTPEIYEFLLKEWGLNNLDLEEEAKKIDLKESNLTKSRRLAVHEFLILKNLLASKEIQEEQEINFNEM